ncbi:MAG TPA: cytochrome c oxidase accessory protein CcoG [Polyangia bacterium]
MKLPLPTPPEDVLSTLNTDGSRRWLRPRLSSGRFLAARRITGLALVALFVALPFLRIGGRPVVLLDVVRWRVTLLGKLFLPSDTILLAIFLVGSVVALFLLTAILGRAWCGFACPQTVYMEFLFRPIERFFEGKPKRHGAAGREVSGPRLIGKYATYAAAAMLLANVFLSYFVGTSSLRVWMTESPALHPMAFFVMALTTALVFFDFTWFREQTCIVACPYGRLQSVLIDRDSLVISYDRKRGEPRGPVRSAKVQPPAASGDCIDCQMCVDTCPTGIDIRGGLRMECIACAQCIDACDAVMDKLHRPRGLIAYSSQSRRESGRAKWFRPRVFIYSSVLIGIGLALALMTSRTQTTDVILLRGLGMPFTVLPSGEVVNPARIKISNRENEERTYSIEVPPGGPARLLLDDEPLRVSAGGSVTRAFLIQVPPTVFNNGQYDAHLRIRDGHAFDKDASYRLLGPHAQASP